MLTYYIKHMYFIGYVFFRLFSLIKVGLNYIYCSAFQFSQSKIPYGTVFKLPVLTLNHFFCNGCLIFHVWIHHGLFNHPNDAGTLNKCAINSFYIYSYTLMLFFLWDRFLGQDWWVERNISHVNWCFHFHPKIRTEILHFQPLYVMEDFLPYGPINTRESFV